MHGHGSMRAWGMHGHGAFWSILRTCTTHSFISYIISFCIASNFHKFDQMNKQKNIATIDFNLDQIASSIFEKLFQE
jgi:hypothetical protein